MKYTDIIMGNAFPHEVEINLNVLGTLMLHRVGGHVDNTDIVAIDQCSAVQGRL